MRTPRKIQLALLLYDIAWRLGIPLLKLNDRLKDGYDSRRTGRHLHRADLWIQAASAGEAYLALSLIETLAPPFPVRVLVTTNTRQGLDIIHNSIQSADINSSVTVEYEFAPFDRPKLMVEMVARIRPKLMVLLETEIWPGLLYALKKNKIPSMIINARLTEKSLGRYMRWPALWKVLGPDRILAISEEDAGRFAMLFGEKIVETMSNIKFDRLKTDVSDTGRHIADFIEDSVKLLVLGSVRQEEEPQIENIIKSILARTPETSIGLFPRHMHRISYWQGVLERINTPWQLRSQVSQKAPVQKGTVILWDTFGELNAAYARANAVFVGGSLAPLGGQNFLEPMIFGIRPVIGPYWENFAWAGHDLFLQGLAEKAPDWQSVASELISRIQQPEDTGRLKSAAASYINERQGGTQQACRLIIDFLTDT